MKIDTVTIVAVIIMLILLGISVIFVGERQEIIDECNAYWMNKLTPEQQQTIYILNYSADTNVRNLSYEFNMKVTS